MEVCRYQNADRGNGQRYKDRNAGDKGESHAGGKSECKHRESHAHQRPADGIVVSHAVSRQQRENLGPVAAECKCTD